MASSSSLYLKFSCLLTVYNFIVRLSDVIHLEYCFAYGKYPVSDGWIDSSSLSVTCMYGMLSVGVFMIQYAFMGQRMTFRRWFSPSNKGFWDQTHATRLLWEMFLHTEPSCQPKFWGPSFHENYVSSTESQPISLGQSLLRNCLRFHSILDSLPPNYT